MFADVNRHLRNRQSKSTTPALLKKSSGAVHILACYFRRCGITRRYVAARPIGILEADTKERWCICNGFNVLNIKSISFHFKQQLSTSRIATNLSNRDKVDRSFRQFTSEKRGQVVHDDVKLAVVTRINKVSCTTLVPPEIVIVLQLETDSRSDAANSNYESTVTQSGFELFVFTFQIQKSSQSGFSAIGCRAVAIVAVTNASG